LGHKADDQVETVVLRLLRGSGLKGLKGMLPIRGGRIIRPLLEVWREEIEDYAKENSIPYLVDSSNLKDDYLRNRLRLNLIPFIEKDYEPGFRRTILRTSTLLRSENDFIEKEAEEAYQDIIHEEENGITFKFSSYRSLHDALQWRVVQKVLERMDHESNWDGGEWSEANLIFEKLLHPQASFLLELSHGLCLEKRYDLILLRKGGSNTIPPFEVELPVYGRTHIQEIGREIVVEERDWDKSQPVDESSNVAFLDYAQLHLPQKGLRSLKNFLLTTKSLNLRGPISHCLSPVKGLFGLLGIELMSGSKLPRTPKKF